MTPTSCAGHIHRGAGPRGLALVLLMALLSGCMSIPHRAAEAPDTAASMAPADSVIGHAWSQVKRPNEQASGLRMISIGVEGLLLRVELIDNAQRSVDLQYYIFRCDDTGRVIQNALLRAADRGVHVRIITDDGETVAGDEKLLLLAAHPNIEVRIFNAFEYRGHNGFLRGLDYTFHKSRLDYRMHNKLLVADSALALTGGRNIGDQYFQVNADSQFGDDDVLAVGPVVKDLHVEFSQYWHSGQVTAAQDLMPGKLTAAALQNYRTELRAAYRHANTFTADFDKRIATGEPLHSLLADDGALTWATATLVYDSPDKKAVRDGARFGQLIYVPVAQRMEATRSELLIITPYFVPIPDERRILKQQHEKKVQVRLLTNSLPAAPDILAQAGYMKYRKELLEEGVKLYEIRADLGRTAGSGQSRRMTRYGTYALHAKLFVYDGSSLFVGSMNLDQRSARINTEMGLIIESSTMAAEVVSRFNKLTSPENAYEVQLQSPEGKHPQLVWKTRENNADVLLTREPARSAAQRLEARLLMLLPIDSEL